MKVCIVTGSGGLIGSESVEFFSNKFDKIIGIDNDSRKQFFGKNASVKWNIERIKKNISNYVHYNLNISNYENIKKVFSKYNKNISLIIHCAAQPSHDWAAKKPQTDFKSNTVGTFNLLELCRIYCHKSVFIFTSTNKVYGDIPNKFSYSENEFRFELKKSNKFFKKGFNENLSIDNCTHSIFGANKLGADILVQEYGKYFKMKTVCFRGGCLTGSSHSGAELHGFLNYLVKCNLNKKKYFIFGYKGKQVRDNIHSKDLVNQFWEFYKKPRYGEVYNTGGGKYSNCSVIEAIQIVQKKTNIKMNFKVLAKNRIGDHIWWISDITKFQKHYKNWKYKYNLDQIIDEIIFGIKKR